MNYCCHFYGLENSVSHFAVLEFRNFISCNPVSEIKNDISCGFMTFFIQITFQVIFEKTLKTSFYITNSISCEIYRDKLGDINNQEL